MRFPCVAEAVNPKDVSHMAGSREMQAMNVAPKMLVDKTGRTDAYRYRLKR